MKFSPCQRSAELWCSVSVKGLLSERAEQRSSISWRKKHGCHLGAQKFLIRYWYPFSVIDLNEFFFKLSLFVGKLWEHGNFYCAVPIPLYRVSYTFCYPPSAARSRWQTFMDQTEGKPRGILCDIDIEHSPRSSCRESTTSEVLLKLLEGQKNSHCFFQAVHTALHPAHWGPFSFRCLTPVHLP